MANEPMYIIQADLDSEPEKRLAISRDDIHLVNYINEYEKVLISHGVEIFKKHNNLLITSYGYIEAVYEKDLSHIDPEE